MKNTKFLLPAMGGLLLNALLAMQTAKAADSNAKGLYFEYPLPTSFDPHYYEVTNEGNGGYGGTLSISRDPDNGDLIMHQSEGQADIYYHDLNLTTGTMVIDVNHPGGPTVYQARKGQEVIGFTTAVLFLQSRADLLRDGITSQSQNQAPDPSAKPVADYLDAFVAQELNGGKALNGIAFCAGYPFGDQYACGAYQCAKTDETYKTPCVVDKLH